MRLESLFKLYEVLTKWTLRKRETGDTPRPVVTITIHDSLFTFCSGRVAPASSRTLAISA